MLDPIDGTLNYANGVPVWATLIALMRGERAVCGVVSAAALGRRWWAATGQGAFTDPGSASTCRGRRRSRTPTCRAPTSATSRPGAASRGSARCSSELACPRVRRFLVAHAGRRRRDRRRRRGLGEPVGRRGDPGDHHRGGRPVQRLRRRGAHRHRAPSSPPTACSTTSWSPDERARPINFCAGS